MNILRAFKWPILGTIPAYLKPNVTHLTVFCQPSNREKLEMLFVVNGDTVDSSKVYKTATVINGKNESANDCLTIDALNGIAIADIVARHDIVLIVTRDGQLFSMGNNQYGQIGNGKKEVGSYYDEPVLIAKSSITQADISPNHCVCLTSTGAVLTWGTNDKRQLGHENEFLVPTKVEAEVFGSDDRKFVQVLCNRESTLFALDNDGQIFFWGNGGVPKKAVVFKALAYWEKEGNVYAIAKHGSVYQFVSSSQDDLRAISAFDEPFAWIDSILAGPQVLVASSSTTNAIYIGGDYSPDGTLTVKVRDKWRQFSSKDGKALSSYMNNDNVKLNDVVEIIQNQFPTLLVGELSPMEAFLRRSNVTPGFIEVNIRFGNSINLATIFDDPKMADFRVVVDGKTIHVHKAILRMRSVHFGAMLSSDHWQEELRNEVQIDHTPYEIYRLFLRYFYCDNFPGWLKFDDAFALVELAQSYFEADLIVNLSSHILRKWLNTEDVMATYSRAKSLHCEIMAGRCLEYILRHLSPCVKSKSFTSTEQIYAKEILFAAAEKNLLS